MIDEEFIFRKAEQQDLEPLIDLTLEAFNGSNGRSFYESLFDISRQNYRAIVKDLFLSGIPNNEYDLNSYFVLERKNEIISCLAGWKEGQENIESERLLPMMVLDHVGIENWLAKNNVIKDLSALNIPREAGKIQIENMFLKSEHRGSSAFMTIYFNTVDLLFKDHPECDTVQSRFFTSNSLAIRIAKHIGYSIVAENSFRTPVIEPFFPNEGLAMTELKRRVFYSNKKFQDRYE